MAITFERLVRFEKSFQLRVQGMFCHLLQQIFMYNARDCVTVKGKLKYVHNFWTVCPILKLFSARRSGIFWRYTYATGRSFFKNYRWKFGSTSVKNWGSYETKDKSMIKKEYIHSLCNWPKRSTWPLRWHAILYDLKVKWISQISLIKFWLKPT